MITIMVRSILYCIYLFVFHHHRLQLQMICYIVNGLEMIVWKRRTGTYIK